MLSKLTSQSLGLGKAQHIKRLFNRFYTNVRTTSFSLTNQLITITISNLVWLP